MGLARCLAAVRRRRTPTARASSSSTRTRTTPFNVTCGYWSPDGLRFLCESGEDAKPADDGIYTMRSSDGGDRFRVTRAPAGHEDQPQGYSPDGSRILFERLSDNEPSAEYVVKTDGTGLVRLSPASLWVIDFARTADWSPDGKHVVFGSAVEG